MSCLFNGGDMYEPFSGGDGGKYFGMDKIYFSGIVAVVIAIIVLVVLNLDVIHEKLQNIAILKYLVGEEGDPYKTMNTYISALVIGGIAFIIIRQLL